MNFLMMAFIAALTQLSAMQQNNNDDLPGYFSNLSERYKGKNLGLKYSVAARHELNSIDLNPSKADKKQMKQIIDKMAVFEIGDIRFLCNLVDHGRRDYFNHFFYEHLKLHEKTKKLSSQQSSFQNDFQQQHGNQKINRQFEEETKDQSKFQKQSTQKQQIEYFRSQKLSTAELAYNEIMSKIDQDQLLNDFDKYRWGDDLEKMTDARLLTFVYTNESIKMFYDILKKTPDLLRKTLTDLLNQREQKNRNNRKQESAIILKNLQKNTQRQQVLKQVQPIKEQQAGNVISLFYKNLQKTRKEKQEAKKNRIEKTQKQSNNVIIPKNIFGSIYSTFELTQLDSPALKLALDNEVFHSFIETESKNEKKGKLNKINVETLFEDGAFTKKLYAIKLFSGTLQPVASPDFILKIIKRDFNMNKELANLKNVNEKFGNMGLLRIYYNDKRKDLKKRKYLRSLPKIALMENFTQKDTSIKNQQVLLHAAKGIKVDKIMIDSTDIRNIICVFNIGESIGALHRYHAHQLTDKLLYMKTFCHGDLKNNNIFYDKATKVTTLIDNGFLAQSPFLVFIGYISHFIFHQKNENQSKYDIEKYKDSTSFHNQKLDVKKDDLTKTSPLYDVLYFMLKSPKEFHPSFVNGYVSSFPEEKRKIYMEEINNYYNYYESWNQFNFK
jgi:hypothetical protein